MMDVIQALILTFIEALCCKIFFDTFLHKRFASSQWQNRILFIILFLGFTGVSFFDTRNYILKALVSIILIAIIMSILHKSNKMQVTFLSVGYYGLVLTIDRIMLIIVQYALSSQVQYISYDPVKSTILALLCKTCLFMCIIFLYRKFKIFSSFNFISDREWIKFLFFPIMTIVSMSAFAIKGGQGNHAVLITSFGLVLSNFMIYYMLSDVVLREKYVQNIRLSRERIKNQMNMYLYMELVYNEQRKKIHEFKNQIDCIQGMLKLGNFTETISFVENINHNWIGEMDYINTNNVIVNTVINQKYKQTKEKGIPIILSINDLGKIPICDQDLVTLLANLLDNAIEACEKIKNNAPIIKFKFVDEDGKITISIRNPIDKPLKVLENKIVTTKRNREEHGIGMINIENVVKKYGGESIFSCNEGYFTYIIIIQYK